MAAGTCPPPSDRNTTSSVRIFATSVASPDRVAVTNASASRVRAVAFTSNLARPARTCVRARAASWRRQSLEHQHQGVGNIVGQFCLVLRAYALEPRTDYRLGQPRTNVHFAARL